MIEHERPRGDNSRNTARRRKAESTDLKTRWDSKSANKTAYRVRVEKWLSLAIGWCKRETTRIRSSAVALCPGCSLPRMLTAVLCIVLSWSAVTYQTLPPINSGEGRRGRRVIMVCTRALVFFSPIVPHNLQRMKYLEYRVVQGARES